MKAGQTAMEPTEKAEAMVSLPEGGGGRGAGGGRRSTAVTAETAGCAGSNTALCHSVNITGLTRLQSN